jgi:hypothetical protein
MGLLANWLQWHRSRAHMRAAFNRMGSRPGRHPAACSPAAWGDMTKFTGRRGGRPGARRNDAFTKAGEL